MRSAPVSPVTFTASASHLTRPKREIDDLPSSQNWVPGEVGAAEDKKVTAGQKQIEAAPSNHESDFAKAVIYGSARALAPTTSSTLQERTKNVDAYASRVVAQIANLGSGSEGERNVGFQKSRQFLEPAGYFSGGLLAAGFDPHEKITVKFNAYVGKGTPEVLTDSNQRTYFAWEIAAGALAHDKVPRGGLINFQFEEIEKKDRSKITNLEAIGSKLQKHWESEIAKPMRAPSGALAERSGRADAYVVRGTLQSLTSDKDACENLSPEAREAIKRTLQMNGQVIVPNLYGYPLAGYAFIPYTPFDGHYENRPDKGVMIDLKNGSISEIKGSRDVSDWASQNRNELLSRFNARDRQGGKDAHWPKAGDVLDNLIAGNHATYPGYSSLLKDKAVLVQETFNYTESRDKDYRLKFGNLDRGLSSVYQEVNAKNAVWSDQTEVFGSSQQSWKAAKEFWGNTFGYVPIVGNAGNIVFGVHDSIYGMSADDRVGGNSAAVISSLLLAHEIAPSGAEFGALETETFMTPSPSQRYRWEYNEQTKSLELMREAKVASDSAMAPTVEAAKVQRADADVIGILPTGEALFSSPEKNVILSGQLNELNALNEKLYTFTDFNKKSTAERLNILVHGSVNPDTGISKVSYEGKLNTPQELLQTLHDAGIHPETFDNVRLLSCDSASGGEQSFAAEFQKLIGRPVKGYSGTLTANLAPEQITAAIKKTEKIYLETLQQQNTTLTPAVRKAVRQQAEDYVAKQLAKESNFKPAKTNPYWNPFKWWAFTYKPVTFAANP